MNTAQFHSPVHSIKPTPTLPLMLNLPSSVPYAGNFLLGKGEDMGFRPVRVIANRVPALLYEVGGVGHLLYWKNGGISDEGVIKDDALMVPSARGGSFPLYFEHI